MRHKSAILHTAFFKTKFTQNRKYHKKAKKAKCQSSFVLLLFLVPIFIIGVFFLLCVAFFVLFSYSFEVAVGAREIGGGFNRDCYRSLVESNEVEPTRRATKSICRDRLNASSRRRLKRVGVTEAEW